MITLTVTAGEPAHQVIIDRLKELSLAFATKEESAQSQVFLDDGTTRIVGQEAILAYLDELEAELRYWYYCAC